MARSYLTILDKQSLPVMLTDINGLEYDSGEISDICLYLECQCGHKFEMLKSEFDSLKPKSCNREDCEITHRRPGRPVQKNREPNIALAWHCPLSIYLILEKRMVTDPHRRSRNQIISSLVRHALDNGA